MVLFTVDEIAAVYRVHEKTVRYWIRKGAVTVVRTPGGAVRIVDEQATRMMAQQGQPVITAHTTP